MRLWSFHPKYLDTKGLLAVWREGLLAQKVLLGETSGYKKHPQLNRFMASPIPILSISYYLNEIYLEAKFRGYKFNRDKIKENQFDDIQQIPVTTGQVEYEWFHFKKKLSFRDQERFEKVSVIKFPDIHPLFLPFSGEIESWERVK